MYTALGIFKGVCLKMKHYEAPSLVIKEVEPQTVLNGSAAVTFNYDVDIDVSEL